MAAHKVWKRRLFYVLGALANHMDGVIRVVGRAPLRWPDRVVGASHRGHKVDQPAALPSANLRLNEIEAETEIEVFSGYAADGILKTLAKKTYN